MPYSLLAINYQEVYVEAINIQSVRELRHKTRSGAAQMDAEMIEPQFGEIYHRRGSSRCDNRTGRRWVMSNTGL